VRQIPLFLALISTLTAADVFDAVCPAKGPVLQHVLETEELLKQSSHCVSPKWPALARQARIHGVVSLTILVDREGKVNCVKLVKGHPLLVGASLDAARKWTFRPMTQGGRPVSFFGHLDFQFFMGGDIVPLPCTSARW
jgi:TonB family protein